MKQQFIVKYRLIYVRYIRNGFLDNCLYNNIYMDTSIFIYINVNKVKTKEIHAKFERFIDDMEGIN